MASAISKSPFSLATDGSSDYDDIKLYPFVIRHFDRSVGRVECLLMRLIESKESTGKAIFELMGNELSARHLTWKYCISFAADNTAVMQGCSKGVVSFIKKEQPSVYFATTK